MKIKPKHIEYDHAPEMPNEWFETEKYGLDGKVEIMGEKSVTPLRLRGRPKKPEKDKKVSLHLRVDPEVAIKFRSLGKGWQTQLNATLVAAIKQGIVLPLSNHTK